MTGMIASVPVVLLLQLRQFTEEPANAPGLLQGMLTNLSEEARETILSLPDIGSRWWIIIGTLTCFLIGCLGKPRKPAGGSYSSDAEAG
ncbi:MAG: hypothetical protein NZ935_12855, partial [Planctomycetes bacterium]|nr:hypothetical protein [Planctomycetota bacterium]